MSSNNNNWIADTICDFIHSPIWAAPIHTFIEGKCAAFDYDDDDDDLGEEDDGTASAGASIEEQKHIFHQYQRLADALIDGLANDLSLDRDELRKVCEMPTEASEMGITDEAYEQLYAARDFEFFQEMMRRKNLILQLQALVSLQLEWGLLRQDDSGQDLVLSLLLQATAATSSSSRRGSVNPPHESIDHSVAKLHLDEKSIKHHDEEKDDDDDVVGSVLEEDPTPVHVSSRKTKERKEARRPPPREYELPSLRGKAGPDLDTSWVSKHRQANAQRDDDAKTTDDEQSKKTSAAQAIRDIPEDVLRQKLRDLAAPTSAVDEQAATAIKSRKNFLREQRDLIVQKQRAERERELERETQEQQQQQQQQQTRPARPQSAAHVARKAMGTINEKEQPAAQIPDAELQRRRAMADRLRREVVDKR